MEIVLFFIAYTIGIAMLILQVICYLKKMEYLVTIFFSLSFLFLITAVSLNDLNFILTNRINVILDEIMTFSMLCLGLTTPLNIHKERYVKQSHQVNIVLYSLSIALFVFLLVGYFAGIQEMADTVIKYFMYGSIGYSMIVILTSKPGMLIKHREKIEKATSIVFFSVFPPLIAIELFYNKLEFLHPFMPQDVHMLMLFFIFLSVMKLLDDIKRLALFTNENSINPHVFARYGITAREGEVLTLIVKGKSYSEIAEQLHISLPTVKTHISRAYKKMNVNNKIELINLLNYSQPQPDPALIQ